MPPERNLARTYHLDANRVNARQGLHDMNQLEVWHANDVITLEMSVVAQQESASGAISRRNKAYGYVNTSTLASTESERQILLRIEGILCPFGNPSQSVRNDAEIAFNARKYMAALITADGASSRQPGGLLGHRQELAELGITVLRDSEAVAEIRDLIDRRDEAARRYSEINGIPLPNWVGRD